jgi:transcriptional regulator with XRE-family HTH domain
MVEDTANLPQVQSSAPKYIPLEKLIEYRKKGLTLEEIGTLTGITKQSVSERLQSADLEGLAVFAEHKADVIEQKQRELVHSLTCDDHKKMSGLQKIIGLKVQEETIRLMRGQPTDIHETRNITIDLSKAYEAMRQSRGDADHTVDIPVDIPSLG